MTPYGQLSETEKEYGYLLPRMKALLADVFPVSVGGARDYTAYLLRDEYVSISACVTEPISSVSVGVKWYTVEGNKNDLDLSCVMLSREYSEVDIVHLQQLKSTDGSVVHEGVTQVDKSGNDDDQLIHMQLDVIPLNVTFLCFYLTTNNGNSLEDVESYCARLLDSETQRCIALLDCDDNDLKRHAALLICMLIRVGKNWVFYNSCVHSSGTTLSGSIDHLKNFIPASDTVQKILIVSLQQHEEHEFEVSDSKCVGIHVDWATRNNAVGFFGASVVMLDRKGCFVDGVDSRRFVSRRGARLSHHGRDSVVGFGEDAVIDLTDPKQENISTYFVILNGRTVSSNLQDLNVVCVRVSCGSSGFEVCRYAISNVTQLSRGVVLIRICKKADDSNVSKLIFFLFASLTFSSSAEMGCESHRSL